MSSFKASFICLKSSSLPICVDIISTKALVSLIANSPLKFGFQPVKPSPIALASGPPIKSIASDT